MWAGQGHAFTISCHLMRKKLSSTRRSLLAGMVSDSHISSKGAFSELDLDASGWCQPNNFVGLALVIEMILCLS